MAGIGGIYGIYGLYNGRYGVQACDVYEMDQCVLAGDMAGSEGGLYTQLQLKGEQYGKGVLSHRIVFIKPLTFSIQVEFIVCAKIRKLYHG